MVKLIEKIFGIKIIKKNDFNEMKNSVNRLASIYKKKAGTAYHHWNTKAEFKLSDVGLICVAENVVNK